MSVHMELMIQKKLGDVESSLDVKKPYDYWKGWDQNKKYIAPQISTTSIHFLNLLNNLNFSNFLKILKKILFN